MIAASKAMQEGARIAPEESSAEFVEAIAAVNDGIVDPVDKLRYLRTSLNHYYDSERVIRRLPWPSARRRMAQLLSFASLQRCLYDSPIPVTQARADTLRTMQRVRATTFLAITASCAVLVALTIRALPERHYGVGSAELPTIDVSPRMQPQKSETGAAVESAITPALELPEAEPIAPPTPREVSTNIWQVDKADGWELYSNGLRIETAFGIQGEPREFFVFAADRAQPIATETQPAGILMHTSESDIWPFEAEFNANIRSSSRGLLRYVQRLRLYNYVIDRFGRVFRVVTDDTRAHHAGHGVWSYNDRYYLNLNSAMLGICLRRAGTADAPCPLRKRSCWLGAV